MTFDDAPESTKQLCKFLLKISNVNKKGGTNNLDFLSVDVEFTFDFLVSPKVFFLCLDWGLPWVYILPLRACNKRYSFCWGILHKSIT
jgi:hypothetical protein